MPKYVWKGASMLYQIGLNMDLEGWITSKILVKLNIVSLRNRR